MKENLNEFVKHRESFRPFAISVSAERAAEYFDYAPSARFMATLGIAKPEAASLLEGFLLPGRARTIARRRARCESASVAACSSDSANSLPRPCW